MRAFLLSLLLASAAAAQTGTIAGQVTEADSITAVIGANIRIEGTTLGAATDLDGNYRIIGIPVGTYSVTVSYMGYSSQTVQGSEIKAGSTSQVNFVFAENYDPCGLVCCYSSPIISSSPFASRIILGDGVDPPNSREDCGCSGGAIAAGG